MILALLLCNFATCDADKASKLTSKVKEEDLDVCLVLFGYSLKGSTAERRTALEAAVQSRSVPAVISRLEFLQQAWCGTEQFVESIKLDLNFVRTLSTLPAYPFIGDCI